VYGLVIQGLERQVWDFPYEALTEVTDEETS